MDKKTYACNTLRSLALVLAETNIIAKSSDARLAVDVNLGELVNKLAEGAFN